mgnify:CR=1 FL=1
MRESFREDRDSRDGSGVQAAGAGPCDRGRDGDAATGPLGYEVEKGIGLLFQGFVNCLLKHI